MSPHLLRWIRRLGALALGSLSAVAAAEGVMRATGIGDPLLADDVVFAWVPGSPFMRDPDPWIQETLRPGYSGFQEYRRTTDGVLVKRLPVRVPAIGGRGPERSLEPAPGVRRILGLGDSLTFGQGVREEETYLAVAERRLGPGVEVINAGVPTWNLVQELEWLETHGLALHPETITLGFFVNDLEPIQYQRPDDVTPAQRFNAPPWARAESGYRRKSFALNYLWRGLERRKVAAQVLDGYHDYTEGLHRALDSEGARRDLGLKLDRLAQDCRRADARCVVLLLPLLEVVRTDPLVDLLGVVGDAARARGLDVLELAPLLAALPPEALPALPSDAHPSATAHAVIGEALADRLR